MTVHIEHTYTPKQYERVTDLWQELISTEATRMSGQYRAYQASEITTEHLAALILADGDDTQEWCATTIDLVSYSDYHGSDYDAANIVYLEESYEWVTIRGYRFDEETAWIQLGELPPCDDIDDGIDQLELLVRDIGGLEGYPIIDEDQHYQYVYALAEKSWDNGWGLSDTVKEAVAAELGETPDIYDVLDDFGVTDDEIKAAYFGHEDTHWQCETATSVVNPEHESVVRDIAQTIAAETIAAWRKPIHPENQLTLIA